MELKEKEQPERADLLRSRRDEKKPLVLSHKR